MIVNSLLDISNQKSEEGGGKGHDKGGEFFSNCSLYSKGLIGNLTA